jgi:16S rRNA (cytosine1402-N4)-methyltransferase
MPDAPSQHVPVLLEEVLAALAPRPGQTVVDGTLGGGGHARAVAERVLPGGRVIALDRDPAAVEAVENRLAGLGVTAVRANFCDLPEVLAALSLPAVDAVLLDLGVSSEQLSDEGRGFSFHSPGKLDLRFNPLEGEPAWRLVNHLSAQRLERIFSQYGEERYSRRIARGIVSARQRRAIETAEELAAVVRRNTPPAARGDRLDPATRVFQALRIAVNDELRSLEIGLRRIPECLRPGGRLAVISFHSLEDRRVKQALRDDPRLAAVTRRPIVPSDEEVARNPRARSAKLRVAERVAGGAS